MWRMARVAAFVGVGVLALAPATAVEAPLLSDAETNASSPLLGIIWNDEGDGRSSLVSLDRRSLRPLPGRTFSLFAGAGSWAYSPDRSRLALAGSCQRGQGLSTGVLLIDVTRLRTTRCLWLGGVTALLWPEPRRLLALTDGVVSIDPVSGTVLGRSPLPLGQLVATARAADRLVLLVASGGFGRLVVVDGRGTVWSTPLEIPAGIQPRDASFVRPGLVVDSRGARAFVVPEAGPVAEVLLGTSTVEYRELRENVSLLGRLAAWLEPRAEAKEIHPSAVRSAVWLGDGKLVVAGTRTSQGTAEPAGLALIDTRTWSRRMLDRDLSSAIVSQGRIVATGPRAGIRVFDVSGRALYRRFDGRDVWLHVAYRGRIFATVGSEGRVRVLAVASGKTVERRSDMPPRLLLETSG